MCACKYGTYKEMKKNKINVSIVLLIADTTNLKKKKRKKNIASRAETRIKNPNWLAS